MTDDYLWNFVRQNRYKAYIREIVQDEVFMQTMRTRLFDQLNIQAAIKNEALSIVPHLTTNHLNAVLGGMVAEKISGSLPTFLGGYLNNNSQMQAILNRHSTQLNRTLQHEADEILKATVRDPKYHTVNRAYFQAFEDKGTKAIQEWTSKADSTLRVQQQKITELENRVRSAEYHINVLGIIVSAGVAGLGAFLLIK